MVMAPGAASPGPLSLAGQAGRATLSRLFVMFIDWTEAGRDALDHALALAPTHLSYPLRAVRDEGCAYIFVAQGRSRFSVPEDRPAIVLIGDDLHAALGPPGFHARSLKRYLARCRAAVIVSCEPLPSAYHNAVSWAVLRREDVLIVETRPEKEADWLDRVRAEAPKDIAILMATVPPEGRA